MTGIIIWIVVLFAVILSFYLIKRKVREFSRSVFHTDSIKEGLEMQADELALTPKSVSGMTRLLEPQIQKDFLEFNWQEFKNKAENVMVSAFLSIDKKTVDGIEESSSTLKQQIENQIHSNEQENITERYSRIKVHQTEIARYDKKDGKCVITLQSAVEYLHTCYQDGKLIEGDDTRLKQSKYNIELMYIQDVKNLGDSKALGLTCPHCGAPVSTLGNKTCEYCGMTIIPVNTRVWSIEKIYKIS